MSKMSFDAKSKLEVFMNKNFESGSTIRLERKKGQMKKSTEFHLSFFCFSASKLLIELLFVCSAYGFCCYFYKPLLLQSCYLAVKWTHRIFGVQLTYAKKRKRYYCKLLKHTDYSVSFKRIKTWNVSLSKVKCSHHSFSLCRLTSELVEKYS